MACSHSGNRDVSPHGKHACSGDMTAGMAHGQVRRSMASLETVHAYWQPRLNTSAQAPSGSPRRTKAHPDTHRHTQLTQAHADCPRITQLTQAESKRPLSQTQHGSACKPVPKRQGVCRRTSFHTNEFHACSRLTAQPAPGFLCAPSPRHSMHSFACTRCSSFHCAEEIVQVRVHEAINADLMPMKLAVTLHRWTSNNALSNAVGQAITH